MEKKCIVALFPKRLNLLIEINFTINKNWTIFVAKRTLNKSLTLDIK